MTFRRSNSDLGYRDLISRMQMYFLEKGYKPGDRIETENELSAKFKVSRAKIREVTSALCHQGLLSRKARAGTVVMALDPTEIGSDLAFRFRMAGLEGADAVEARQVIETAILPLVVRRITPSHLSKLDEICDRMEASLDNPKAADQADRDFHLELLHACGNQTLQIFAGVVQELFLEQVRQKYWEPEMLRKALEEHRALLEAIRADDTAKALDILRHHWH